VTLKDLPTGVGFKPPEFGSIEFSVTAGEGKLPADIGVGFAGAYKIKL
jgi:hypothetical protein